MTCDKRPEGFGKPDAGQVRGNRADDKAIENQVEQAADAEDQAARKSLEADADIVVDVKTKHVNVSV